MTGKWRVFSRFRRVKYHVDSTWDTQEEAFARVDQLRAAERENPTSDYSWAYAEPPEGWVPPARPSQFEGAQTKTTVGGRPGEGTPP